MSLLIYGITRRDSLPDFEASGIGGAPVALLTEGDVAMLVSEYEGEELSPRRRNLSEFQRVVNAAAARTDILPSAFGMISDDADAVRDLLARHAELIDTELRRIAGRHEFSLRIRWNGENIFAWFVERFESLRSIRDRFFEGGRIPTHDERIQLGQGFEKLLASERARILSRVVEMLGDRIDEWQETGHPNESTLCSLALLVRKDRDAALDAAVEALASEYDDNHVIELLGPWPPYAFVQLRLE